MQYEGADALVGNPPTVWRLPWGISKVGSGYVRCPVTPAEFVDTTLSIAYICLNFLGDAVILIVGYMMVSSWLWSPAKGQLDTTPDGEGASAQFPGWILVIRRRTDYEV